MRYDALVLAGGQARRMDGTDKLALEVGGRTLLDRVVAAVADADRIVVVGPERSTDRPVTWCREDPPGGGPVAGIAAGLAELGITPGESMITDEIEERSDAGGGSAEGGGGPAAGYVAVLAGDLPFIDGATVRRLLAVAAGHDGALMVDADGRDQLLCAVYRAEAVAAELAGRPAAGRSLRELIAGLDLVRLADPSGAAFDTDTWHDLELAREAETREAQRARELDRDAGT